MKTQAKWEDRRKEKMMFKDYKLSQEALEHNATVSLCFPGGPVTQSLPSFSLLTQVEWSSVTSDDPQEERNKERCIAQNHDYEAKIHVW